MTDDDQGVLAAFDALDDLLEARDLDAALGLWLDDDDLTFWGSAVPEVAVGKHELRHLLKLVTTMPGSFRIRWHSRRVTVNGDTAWVNAAGTATWDRGQGDVVTLPYRSTAIFVRQGATWLWHTHHGSEPQELELPGADRLTP